MVDEPYRPQQTLYIEFCRNKTGAESMRYAQDSYLRSTWYRKYYTMEVLRHVKSTLRTCEGQIVNALRFNPKVYNPRLLPTTIGPVVLHNCGDKECAYVGILDCWYEFAKDRGKSFLYFYKFPDAQGD